jgi:hypothetical protein
MAASHRIPMPQNVPASLEKRLPHLLFIAKPLSPVEAVFRSTRVNLEYSVKSPDGLECKRYQQDCQGYLRTLR